MCKIVTKILYPVMVWLEGETGLPDKILYFERDFKALPMLSIGGWVYLGGDGMDCVSCVSLDVEGEEVTQYVVLTPGTPEDGWEGLANWNGWDEAVWRQTHEYDDGLPTMWGEVEGLRYLYNVSFEMYLAGKKAEVSR